MFEYNDPAGEGILESAGALTIYRSMLHGVYRSFGRRPRSAFTIPEAFVEANKVPQVADVSWLAFPRLDNPPDDAVEQQRLKLQDEYVEWFTERAPNGGIRRVIFTTEFPEYYEALAERSATELVSEVARVTGGTVTNADVFGANFNPDQATPAGRAARFSERTKNNPWNTTRSILCLTHPLSTLSALFNLVTECAVARPASVTSAAVCGLTSNACVDGRNSDPAVCQAVQELARQKMGLTLPDPPGVEIGRLGGIWKLDGTQIEPNSRADIWRVSRNRRRAELVVTPSLTIGDNPIASGAQVAKRLQVSAKVMFLPDADLPSWGRIGQESSRMLSD
jgi:hypothetical protein